MRFATKTTRFSKDFISMILSLSSVKTYKNSQLDILTLKNIKILQRSNKWSILMFLASESWASARGEACLLEFHTWYRYSR